MTDSYATDGSSEMFAQVRAVNKRRKALFVQTQAENAGAQEIARQLALGAERQGWDTRQVFFFRRTASFDNDASAIFCARERPSTPIGVVRLLFELYRLIREESPDVVVSFQHYGNVIAAPIARLLGVQLVIANQMSETALVPSPVCLVDWIIGQMGFYDRIVVNSSTIEETYRSYPAAYRRRLKRIDHGFADKSSSLDKSSARLALGLPLDVELLGCAARLNPLKQLDLAIRLLPVDKNQHFAVAGQGTDIERLEAIAVELGVRERVHFLGEIDSRMMGVFLSSLDCFVFPSATESFGLAPVEAAQAGVPVVANDLQVLREVLAVDGEPCALFVDAHEAAAFAAAVRRVLDDSKLREALTARGRRLRERYPLERMIDEFLVLMELRSP
jgi:glycosyltransferase involved in cell wall biosynthesis